MPWCTVHVPWTVHQALVIKKKRGGWNAKRPNVDVIQMLTDCDLKIFHNFLTGSFDFKDKNKDERKNIFNSLKTTTKKKKIKP